MRWQLSAVGCAVAVVTIACSDNSTEPNRFTLEAMTPLTQNGVVAEAVAQTPTVRVTDSRGRPVSGIMVNFRVSAGSGRIDQTAVASNSAGLASPGAWVLGNGATKNWLIAQVENAGWISFSAVGSPGPLAAMRTYTSKSQIGFVSDFVDPPRIEALDKFANRIPGVRVRFSVAGGGTVQSSESLTDDYGIATSISWLLGPTAGLNSVVASVDNFEQSITFEASGIHQSDGIVFVIDSLTAYGRQSAPSSWGMSSSTFYLGQDSVFFERTAWSSPTFLVSASGTYSVNGEVLKLKTPSGAEDVARLKDTRLQLDRFDDDGYPVTWIYRRK